MKITRAYATVAHLRTTLSTAAFAIALGILVPSFVRGETAVQWTTNYYFTTGADFRAIRASIKSARPRKLDFDAETKWQVEWHFTVARRNGQCTCTSFNTKTTIVTTLPAWAPSTEASPRVHDEWTHYFQDLARHESGHARNGIAAAAEIEKLFRETPPQADCDALKKLLHTRAQGVIADYSRRDEEYDRETEHGAKPATKP